MLVQITSSIVNEKFAKINFIHPRNKDTFPEYYSEAVAFPVKFNNNEKINVPFEIFKNALLVGISVNVVWSKKLNCYVVRL